jgi:uncharacterized protein YdbL (DUF1318 family)
MMTKCWIASAALLAAGCKGPTVSLSTPEPIVVDINMRVDIYDRGGGGAGAGAAKPKPSGDVPAADARRRARMGDIQTFKNSRLVGENRQGLLVVRDQPAGSYGQYVAKLVAEENTDRLVLMRQLAAERNMSLEDVQKQQGELWRNRSFSGEWIEVPQDNNTWRWGQKP